MYQGTIKQLEDIIEKKDERIQKNLEAIAQLTEGKAEELNNIKL